MAFLKKHKKTLLYGSALLILLIGGTLFTLSKESILPTSLNVFSNCNFSPEISEKNKKLIQETITTVADGGLLSLAGKESHLKEMGAILSKEVPDLTYWAYILSTPKLLRGIKTIQKSSPKYHGFIKGTRDRLMREYHENHCLLEQAKGFAKYLKLPEDKTVATLKECIENDSKGKYEFKKFLDFIINNKN